jgi:hypothetical protein
MDLTKIKKPIDNTKKPIILFFNGVFSPIHDGKVMKSIILKIIIIIIKLTIRPYFNYLCR